MAEKNMNFIVMGTMDTKGKEMGYIKDIIEDEGYEATVIDVGVLKKPPFEPDITKKEVAARAGFDEFPELLDLRRDKIMDAMGRGAAKFLQEMYKNDNLNGVIGVGGNQGTAINSIALKQLPFGVPKIVVSTVASGNIRPFIGNRDINMLFSVADILGGPNTVTSSILSNAAGALLGMGEVGKPMSVPDDKLTISTTAFGNTNDAVTKARELLVEDDYEVIAFHASGACGAAMEDLIDEGIIKGVLDITTHELLGEIFGDDIYEPVKPGRLKSAGEKGIPQVVSLGGLDYFCFGPEESIPEKYRDRRIYHHNPYNTNVRTTKEESAKIGRVLAERLNQANGEVAMMIPLKGWSENGRKGGPLHDPEIDEALIDAFEKEVSSEVEVIEIDANINDPIFAQRCAKKMKEFMSKEYS